MPDFIFPRKETSGRKKQKGRAGDIGEKVVTLRSRMNDVIRRLATALWVLSAAISAAGCHAQAWQGGDSSKGQTTRREDKALTVAFLGDSNLWIGGDDCSRQQSWSYWFCRKMNPGAARSYARSGATWTHTAETVVDTAFYSEVLADNNVIMPQAERLTGDVEAGRFPAPSVIFIAAGTNDAWFAERRPGLWDDNPSIPTTLTGSITATVKRVREAFPQARIVLLTPPPTAATTPQRIERVSNIIVSTAQASGVEVVRPDTLSQINPQSEKRKPHFTTDGTHTSAEGGKLIASVVITTIFQIE